MNKSVSGITKRNKRSIQELKRSRQQEGGDGSGRQSSGGTPRQQPPGQRGNERAATFGLWFVGIIGILFLFFLFSVVFAETTVTVHPKTATISIDDRFVASNDSATPGIPYSVVSVKESISMTATSTGTEYREAKASGQITIYNEHTTEDIRLVPNTRFQAPSGKIYRTRSAVTVPGRSGGQPGTITVPVDADEAGSEYNIGQVEFSIPGFAGTEYEGNVYARSASAMTGGVAGEVPVIATSTRQQIEQRAADQLEADLLTEIRADLPDGFILYDSAQFFSARITDSEETSASTTDITVTGQLQAVTFDSAQLSSHLAVSYSDDVSQEDQIRIQDLDQFTFSFVDKTGFNPSTDQSFEFTLSGDSVIVWQYDERALVRDLRGLQKDQLDEVLVNYPGIQEAEVVTRPFWKRTLPEEAAEITVRTVVQP